MFRIRIIYDDVLPLNKRAIAEVQTILGEQFDPIPEKDITSIPEKLANPLKYRFRSVLFVAEGNRGQVKGFAFLLHEPELNFCFLDYISAAKQVTGRGIGGALYARVRQEAASFKTIGIFMECLPDDPKLSKDPEKLKQNKARLKFYENYGARPIINTAYETPVKEDEDNPPYLLFDDLGQNKALKPEPTRKIVRAILERKYSDYCPPDYIQKVVYSFKDNPIQLRSPKYRRKETPASILTEVPPDKRITVIVNDKHEIHHIKERGYVEAPIRIRTILKELAKSKLFEISPVKHYSDKYIREVHDSEYISYFKKVCETLEPGKSIYPYVFPIRNSARPPKELPVRAGYYCIDTFTPLNQNAYLAAKRAVDCALTAADHILDGGRIGYALVRPPGHHAERKVFGGFCYFNSNAIAANYLSRYGRVAILDLDYHHGNGQQNIFYKRNDVFTISIHGHPRFAYPYFSGFADEKGEGPGEGFNINFPLPENIDGAKYRETLEQALKSIKKFHPNFLVLALGLDPAKGDPTGTWSLKASDFEQNGKMVGSLKIPVAVIQEGGYNNMNLGVNARHFFTGLWTGMFNNLVLK
jgi:acetoin utilization deacetylase AcuC-like enzyme/GNAT superfamily N-acetyltransferase